jgi:hypothetical protein
MRDVKTVAPLPDVAVEMGVERVENRDELI